MGPPEAESAGPRAARQHGRRFLGLNQGTVEVLDRSNCVLTALDVARRVSRLAKMGTPKAWGEAPSVSEPKEIGGDYPARLDVFAIGPGGPSGIRTHKPRRGDRLSRCVCRSNRTITASEKFPGRNADEVPLEPFRGLIAEASALVFAALLAGRRGETAA